ncbi:MAG: beta-ACP synthase [Chitinophagaceae bacterium]
MQKQRVVVTGLGGISGIGKNIPEIWKSIVDCKPGIGPIEAWDMNDFRFKNGAEIKNYDPSKYFSSKDILTLDKNAQFALIAAREAIADANIDWTEDLKENTCIVTGCSIGGQDTQDEGFHDLYIKHKTSINPLTIPRIMPNAGASHISMTYGITGMAYTITTACASSNHAIGNAFWMLRNGICDLAITGGNETPLSYGFLKAWEAIRVISTDTCRPFSKGRLGMILGEGSAMMVLEPLEAALKRGAKIYAEIVGFGMSSDAGHITRPTQRGPEKAMQLALKDAGVPIEQIDYINAHGTGTQANDPMETAAIKAVFGDHAKKLAVSSTKSLHGHMLGATSAMEAVATVLALQNQVYPPTANFLEKDEECDLDVVPNASRKGKMNYAMSNAFAFGGLNAVLVFKKWEGE